MSLRSRPGPPLQVLHLAGSTADDLLADVSRLYARDALAATADPERYEHHVALVEPDGGWRFPVDLEPASLDAAPVLPLAAAIAQIADLGIDVMVPQMFCVPGMTTYRALFELLDIPFIGNRPGVMALGADKAQAKAVVAAADVAVPAGAVVRPGDPCPLALPVVVKPVDSDNSVGVSLVTDPAAYDAAVADACAAGGGEGGADGRALVETYVELGREVRCGVVDVEGELVCLPLEEYAVDAASKPIRGMDDKLARDGSGELGLVAKDAEHAWLVAADDPDAAAVHEAALRCYRALGCRHYGLFDFRVDPDGTPYFLEAGLYCSYARTSVVVVMAAAAGLSVERLFALAVDDAVGRAVSPEDDEQ